MLHETFDGYILAIRTSKKYDLKYPLTLRPETHLLTVLSQLFFFVWMCYPSISKLQGGSVNLLTRHVSYITTYSLIFMSQPRATHVTETKGNSYTQGSKGIFPSHFENDLSLEQGY